MRRFFPFLQWLPEYQKSWLSKDIVAGLTVGIILIPQGMAYAMIAGLPPVYGLYASLIPVLVYAFLGTSRQLAVGPVAMDSLLVAAGLGAMAISGVENYIAMALFLAFLVGAIQLILGLFRMGFLVNFLSKPVISGFTSGAAVIIIFSQLKHLLGADIQKSNQFHQLVLNAFEKISETNLLDFAIGISGILIIVLLKKWSKKIPGILIAVILGVLAVYFLNLESYGVGLVGSIPDGLPSFQIPDFSIENFKDLWPIALALALVGYLEAISIGKSIEDKNGEETIDSNQELVALGASNMAGSFFQAFPITASFSRSAINNESGAKTTIASVISVVMVVLTLLFLTPLFYYLPNAVLASIIMVSVFGLIDVSYARSLWKHRKDEFFVLLLTFLATLFIGIKEGILMGVLFSLLLLVYRTSKPHFAVLGNVRDSDYYKNIDRFGDEAIIRDDLLIVRFDAQLYFGNAGFFKRQLLKHVEAKGSMLRGVILNAEAINYIDSTAAQILTKTIHEIHERGLQFYIAGAIGPTRDIIFSSGIINELDKKYLFVQTKEAVACFDNPYTISEVGSKVAYQNRLNSN
ncbi:SulP family inorganic anion transporter [Maribacter halichondriae]|uniref:SulP family inorganic anion transporter n=1 Tax=Maribacter halichondriae TaxID=2980554 RepID=UPI0023590634|nr:SulP family inorganic anion transporter [Maribacter sp. Hal144]